MFFKELYDYRYLLREIVVKNIKIQYRNSVLGMFWTLLQPLLTTLVLVFVFENVFGKSSAGVINYPIYLLCGRLLFEFYSHSTKRAMRSITGSASVLKKVKVPKYIYPVSNVISNFVTFAISLIVLLGFCAFYFITDKHPPHITPYVFLAVVPMLILFLLSMGVGLILSTLSVFFKDVEYLYDVFCLLLFYATPIVYNINSLSPSKLQRMALMANPLYSIVEMFRDCVLRGELLNPNHILYALGFSLLMLAAGIVLFWRKQDKFILHI